MSVIGNIIGMPPGAGGSFPYAGTRPKIRRTLFLANGSSSFWVAPPGVYHVILQMVGGGGGGPCVGYSNPVTYYVRGGGGGASILPSVVQVNPGTQYYLISGRGGAGAVNNTSGVGSSVLGSSGTPSIFSATDGTLHIAAEGGRAGGVTEFASTNFTPNATTSLPTGSNAYAPTSSYQVLAVAGGSGGGPGSGSSAITADAMSGQSVEFSLGGRGSFLTFAGVAAYMLGGGGASAYSSGSSAPTTTTGTPLRPAGFGGGGAPGITSAAGAGSGTSSSGSGGFVRIVWEE